jgi:hypothetical protein
MRGRERLTYGADVGRPRLRVSLRPAGATLRRVALAASGTLVLAGADIVVKQVLPTHAWAMHERSAWWAAGSLLALLVVLWLAVLPSRRIVLAAAVAAGGVAGNLVSGLANGLRVPNPFVVETPRSVLAFNLADILTISGALLLTVSLSPVTYRNRHLLPTGREVAAFWRTRLVRLLAPYQP